MYYYNPHQITEKIGALVITIDRYFIISQALVFSSMELPIQFCYGIV